MHYLIDGYNLFFRTQEEVLPLDKKRKNFALALDHLFASINISCTLIFDSGRRLSASFPSKQVLSCIEIVFSPENLSADDYMIEWLATRSDPQNFIVVTSDRELSRRAARLGAKTATLDVFFSFLRKKQSKHDGQAKEKKPLVESKEHFNRLLKLFNHHLKDPP